MSEPTTKKFGSGERTIPHHSEKAPKYYPAEDVAKPKTVRITPFFAQFSMVVVGWLEAGQSHIRISHTAVKIRTA
jgi:hypothetical protein